MQTKDFTDVEDALNFAEELSKSDNTVDLVAKGSGVRVSWISNKKYIGYGSTEEFTDEVWMTEDEKMICIQDLTEAHAKNILRMILRTQRDQRNATAAILDKLSEVFEAIKTEIVAETRTLH